MPRISKQDQRDAVARLREWVKPGDTVYCILRHVSSSGMSRVIDLKIIHDGAPLHIGYNVAKALGMSWDDRRNGIKVGGCGMDMGFALVYELAHALFPDGFGVVGTLPLGHSIRPQTKEQASEAVARGAVFRGRNGDDSGWDNDGGYALKHSWL